MPGLIPGASEGKGLGLEFLRHVERCAVLVHVLDCATLEPGRDPISRPRRDRGRARRVRRRSAATLADRPRLVVLNKIDVPGGPRARRPRPPRPRGARLPVFAVSAATHEGLRELAFAMAALVARGTAAAPPVAEPTRGRAPPAAVDDAGFTVERETRDGGRFRVRGEQPERWVRQTDFANDEAVGYLADRLARLGVEEELAEAGRGRRARRSSIGDDAVVFDWEPDARRPVPSCSAGRGAATCGWSEQPTRASARPRRAPSAERPLARPTRTPTSRTPPSRTELRRRDRRP